ncbi:SUMF1/EgtB/PvdO family nonheme iron enzyme [Microvirga yunnanensis]|uniref:SUMF1/EgtB/PvdO family nonheme iron enzyme n=1 Tax=Microvirga yunnanensis TaxID=2953740 RepID=UPI00359FE6C3
MDDAGDRHGRSPDVNSRAAGYRRTSPVAAVAPSGSGPSNTAGNVREWAGDPFKMGSLAGRLEHFSAKWIRFAVKNAARQRTEVIPRQWKQL